MGLLAADTFPFLNVQLLAREDDARATEVSSALMGTLGRSAQSDDEEEAESG